MKTLRIVGWLVLAGTLSSCDTRRGTEFSVQYRVTGTARAAEVKYRLPQGGAEQRTVSVPFTTGKYSFPVGARVFIEARNTGASGDLRVQIVVNGEIDPWFHARAYTTNAYSIVTASGSVGVQ